MNPAPPQARAGTLKALRYLALAGVLLLAARAGVTILREPCVGVADNLDYWRVARPAGIQVDPQPRQGSHVVCSYPLTTPDLKESLTSPSLLAWLVTLPQRGTDGGSLDLRRIGTVYWLASVAVLAAAFFAGVNVLPLLMIAWVVYDPGFLLFFNSLYADPALIVAQLATVLLLGLDPLDPRRVKALALLVGAAAVAGFSKMQYSPFPAVLLGVCLLALVFHCRVPSRTQAGLLLVLLALAVAAPLHFVYGPAPRFLDANNYNATFGGIARVAADPAAALAALGIPEEHRGRKPKDYFAADSGPDDPVMPALRRLSRLRLLSLYLTDGTALSRTAQAVHADLGKVRTHPRGTFTRGEGGRPSRVFRTPEQFSLWRGRLLHRIPLWSLLLLGGVAAFLAARAVRSGRGRWTAGETVLLFLVLWSTSQFAVAVLGEGFVNLHQHLLGARLGLDLLLVLVLCRLLLLVTRRDAPADAQVGQGSAKLPGL